jgi:hypothetical protein
VVYERPPREDRFNRPSPQTLRRGLSGDAARLFDRTRKHLLNLDGVEEQVVWYGRNWCWSIAFVTKRNADPLAVLIPSPEDLQLAMPLDLEFITNLPVKRMKRSLRDGLDLASEPFDTRWGIWSIQPGGVLDDLKDLVDRRFAHVKA